MKTAPLIRARPSIETTKESLMDKVAKCDVPVKYGTVHRQLRQARGKASEYPCLNCGNPAEQWAYDHEDSDELTEVRLVRGSTVVVAYSLDLTHYDPLCRACHQVWDGGTCCQNGHEWTPENTYIHPTSGRRCRACRRVPQHSAADPATDERGADR